MPIARAVATRWRSTARPTPAPPRRVGGAHRLDLAVVVADALERAAPRSSPPSRSVKKRIAGSRSPSSREDVAGRRGRSRAHLGEVLREQGADVVRSSSPSAKVQSISILRRAAARRSEQLRDGSPLRLRRALGRGLRLRLPVRLQQQHALRSRPRPAPRPPAARSASRGARRPTSPARPSSESPPPRRPGSPAQEHRHRPRPGSPRGAPAPS